MFLFHNTSPWCFLPPSHLPTTYCDGKIIYSAAFNDFHSFFQCFCGPTSLNFAFLHLFSSPTSLYTCVKVSVSVFFAFLMLIFFNLLHTIASSFLSSSINKSSSYFFFWKKKKKNSFFYTLFFCSYLLSLGLSISALGFTLQILYFSVLDLCSLGTSLGLGWVEILLLLLLCIGFWGELADQGEAQWSPTSLASLYKFLPVAIGLLSWHSV